MKKLISVHDIKAARDKGMTKIYVDSNTLITPAAKDAACEFHIIFTDIPEECIEEPCTNETGKGNTDVSAEKSDEKTLEVKTSENVTCDKEAVDMNLIYKIVKEVLAQSVGNIQPEPFEKECDSSGLRLIRGNTVKCERFDSGNPNSNVGLKDIVSTKESPNMGAGFMTIEKSSFDWELCYEEFDYIVEGNLDITINGKRYKGKKGDVFFIPKNSKITWSTPDFARFFYVTYPANWAELAANK